jgi:drug/metabolite transporter (DMT)-like permease
MAIMADRPRDTTNSTRASDRSRSRGNSGRIGAQTLDTAGAAPTPTRLKLALAFAAIYVIWGSTYLAIRFAVDTLPPFLMAGMRFITAGGILFAITARGRLRGVGWRQWGAATIVGACMFLGGNGLLSWAEQGIDSGVAALVIASIPVWLMVLEWLSGGRRPTPRAVLGVVIGMVGVAILVLPGQRSAEVRGGPLEFGALIAASISWSIGSLYMRRAPLPSHSGLTTSMQMLGGGFAVMLVAIALGEWGEVDLGSVSRASWLSVAYLVVFGSLVALSAYTYAIRNTAPVYVGTYAFVNPVIAVLLGVLLAGETLNALVVAAGVTIVVGVALVMIPQRRRFKTSPPTPARRA